MSDAGIADQVFLLSSALENPDRLFQGYCFVGSDYIYGQAGADSYRCASETEVGAAQDGCYVSVRRSGTDYVFDTDYGGNKKLFYYWDPGFWVVSNSLHAIVVHLRANSIRVAANLAQLLAVGHGKSSALNQVIAYHTVASGVHLVPPRTSLRIGREGVTMFRQPTVAASSFPDALGKYLGIWIARLRTLLQSEQMTLQCDLTGGVDSRAVFALLKAARDGVPEVSAQVRIKSGPSGGDATDLEIATEICSQYGFDLNTPRKPDPNRFSADESFSSWLQLCLGVYHPIYFPVAGPRGNRVSFGGGGGENYRRFYKEGSIDEFIEKKATTVANPNLRRQFTAELSSTFRLLESLDGSDTDPLILHYRHFRNRFHSGRAPQYGVLFSPLASGLLESVASVAPKEVSAVGTLNYEIMNALVPELLSIRFDHPRKTPDASIRKSLASVRVNLDETGSIHGLSSQNATAHAPSPVGGSPWLLLRDEFRRCIATPYVIDVWGNEFLARVGGLVDRAVDQRKLDHPVDGQPIAAVLATKMFA